MVVDKGVHALLSQLLVEVGDRDLGPPKELYFAVHVLVEPDFCGRRTGPPHFVVVKLERPLNYWIVVAHGRSEAKADSTLVARVLVQLHRVCLKSLLIRACEILVVEFFRRLSLEVYLGWDSVLANIASLHVDSHLGMVNWEVFALLPRIAVGQIGRHEHAVVNSSSLVIVILLIGPRVGLLSFLLRPS